MHDSRAERRREGHPAVEEPLRVGAEHRHVELSGDFGDLALARCTGFASLLAEPGADDDRGLRSNLSARSQRRGDMLGRDGDDREVHRPGQRLYRRVAGDTGDLVVASAYRVEWTVEPVQGHRLDDPPADEGLVRRRTDERDRARPEQGIQVRHG